MATLTEELAILINTQFDSSGLTTAKNMVNRLKENIDTTFAGPKIKSPPLLRSVMDNFGQQVRKSQVPKMLGQLKYNLYDAAKAGGTLSKTGKTLFTNLDTPGLKRISLDYSNIGRTAAKVSTALPLMNKQMSIQSRIVKESAKADALKQQSMAQNLMTSGLSSKELDKSNKSMIKSVKGLKQTFSMQFLGIMFGGMAIQKLFQGMATTAKQSFMQITQGQGEAANAFMALDASIQLVRFSLGEAIGSALIPFIPKIIEIAEKVSDWIQNNKELTSGIVIGGIALGAFMMTIGQTVLVIEALINTLKGLIPASLVGKMAAFIKLNGLSTFITIIGEVIFWLAILLAAWQVNFGKIQETTFAIVNRLWRIFRIIFDNLVPLFTDMFGLIKAIFEGDWNLIITYMSKVGLRLLKIIVQLATNIIGLIAELLVGVINLFLNLTEFLFKIMGGIVKVIVKGMEYIDIVWSFGWLGIYNIVLNIWNMIVTGVEVGINSLIVLINAFIEALPALVKETMGIEKINNLNFDGAKAEVKSFDEILKQATDDAAIRANQANNAIDNMVDLYSDLSVNVEPISEFFNNVSDSIGESFDSKIAEWDEVAKALEEPTKMIADNTVMLADATESLVVTVERSLSQMREEIDLKTQKNSLITEELDLMARYQEFRETHIGDFTIEEFGAYDAAKQRMQTGV